MKKNEILNAAFGLFARQGYEATTMQQISESVRLKKQSLYAYFSSKSEIYITILKIYSREYADFLFKMIGNMKIAPPEDILKSFFKVSVKYFDHKEKLLFYKHAVLAIASKTENEIYPDLLSALLKTHKEIAMRLYRAVRRHRPDLNKKKTLELLVNLMIMLQGFLDWLLVHVGEKKRIELLANKTWDNFWKQNRI